MGYLNVDVDFYSMDGSSVIIYRAAYPVNVIFSC